MKNSLILLLVFFSGSSFAQWAVHDEELLKEVRKINNVYSRNIGTLKDLESPVKLEKLDVDFSKLSSLTDADKKKYIGTVEDCGDEKLNPQHFAACVGLRNLRIQTLKQRQSILGVLDERRKTIDQTIKDARNNTNQESGILQRYHFELQGLQAQMQSDAMKLEILLGGYRDRERVYEMQMAEARRVSDTRQPDALVKLGPVPFIKPPRGW